jgi:hypothetical protein
MLCVYIGMYVYKCLKLFGEKYVLSLRACALYALLVTYIFIFFPPKYPALFLREPRIGVHSVFVTRLAMMCSLVIAFVRLILNAVLASPTSKLH